MIFENFTEIVFRFLHFWDRSYAAENRADSQASPPSKLLGYEQYYHYCVIII